MRLHSHRSRRGRSAADLSGSTRTSKRLQPSSRSSEAFALTAIRSRDCATNEGFSRTSTSATRGRIIPPPSVPCHPHADLESEAIRRPRAAKCGTGLAGPPPVLAAYRKDLLFPKDGQSRRSGSGQTPDLQCVLEEGGDPPIGVDRCLIGDSLPHTSGRGLPWSIGWWVTIVGDVKPDSECLSEMPGGFASPLTAVTLPSLPDAFAPFAFGAPR